MKKTAIFVSCALVLSSCVSSQKDFYNAPSKVSKASLCRTFVKASDPVFRDDLAKEMQNRNITAEECIKIKNDQDVALAVGATIAIVGLAAAACSGGGCASGGGRSFSNQADWDQFFGAYGQLVWACREVYTGQFTEKENCYGKPMNDYRWPTKSASI